jgi:uncharacterized DUF497 family protein
MEFVWSVQKAATNFAKHGVSFEEAVTAFHDPLSRAIGDPDHSVDELRCLLIGLSARGRLLVVAHADLGERNSESSAHGSQLDASDARMKKRRRNEMRREYDFSEGVRGKYIARLSRGSNVVVLDADVAAVYRDSKSVNGALRKLAGLPTPRKRATRAQS